MWSGEVLKQRDSAKYQVSPLDRSPELAKMQYSPPWNVTRETINENFPVVELSYIIWKNKQ